MSTRWKQRMDRLGRANEAAREEGLQSLTLEKAARVMEGLLSCPAVPAAPRTDHPVSLSRRRRRHV